MEYSYWPSGILVLFTFSASSVTSTAPEVGTNTAKKTSKWDETQLVASNVSDDGTTGHQGNAEHDREIGHPMEVIGAAGLAKCTIHFR